MILLVLCSTNLLQLLRNTSAFIGYRKLSFYLTYWFRAPLSDGADLAELFWQDGEIDAEELQRCLTQAGFTGSYSRKFTLFSKHKLLLGGLSPRSSSGGPQFLIKS